MNETKQSETESSPESEGRKGMRSEPVSSINTGGGIHVGRDVTANDGDVVMRDKITNNFYLASSAPEEKLPDLPPAGILPEPGKLPPGSRMPYLRNQVFIGREEDLKKLAIWVFQGEGPAAISQPAAVSGLGNLLG